MPEDMPEDMSEHLSENMPEDTRTSGKRYARSDRMPENISNRMPEDLPVRKSINVMMGIIRSKVIFWFGRVRLCG